MRLFLFFFFKVFNRIVFVFSLSSFPPLIFVFSIYLFYNTVRCVFVCLFVKCAYAREEMCASSSFTGTCMPSNGTKGHKKGENRQKTRAISSFAGTCSPSNSTKRHKKREKQQKAHASSSFAGYSTHFRGTFSLFLARKTPKNDFTHWNIVQMKIFQGLYSRISRSERWVFFFWFKFDFFLLQGAFFVHFSPTFRPPKTTFFRLCTIFIPPKHQYIIHETPSRRGEIDNKRGSIDNTCIKRKLRINKKKTTRKTRRSNT